MSEIVRERWCGGQLFGRILSLIVLLVLAGCGGATEAVVIDPPLPLLGGTPTPAPTPTLVPALPSWSAGDSFIPELGNAEIDVLAYDLAVKLDPSAVFLEGVATVRMRSHVEGLRKIALDLIGYEVSQVTMNGLPVPFSRARGKLIIDSPVALTPEWRAELVIRYAGVPVRERSPYNFLVEHLGLRYPGDGTVFAVTQPDGARYWFPCNDTVLDKANFRIEVTTPPGLTGVANGKLVSQQTVPDGELYVWEHASPMPPYLATVAVGPFVPVSGGSVNGVVIQHYALPGYEELLRDSAENTAAALTWMSDLLAPYPFESFGFVTVDMPNLSLETQTMSLLSTSALNEETVIHELSHMWFGNWVTLESWREMWRNEGFATYIEYMWMTDDIPALLDQRMLELENTVIARGGRLLLGSTAPDQLFSFVNYYQGAVVIHKLRRDIGDQAFFGGLRTYFNTYGGTSASDAEFRAVMEQAAGRPLTEFWQAWFAN